MQQVVIIGAGFSKPFGLPLASEVLPWLFERWRKTSGDNVWQETRAQIDYWLAQGRKCGAIGEQVDFESFLAFLRSASSVWRHTNKNASSPCGADRDSAPPSPSHVHEILESGFMYQIQSFQEDYRWDQSFLEPAAKFVVGTLRPGDTVLTFNYDSILARSFCRTPPSLGGAGEGVPHRKGVAFYYLHGCAEWMVYQLPGRRDDDPDSTICLMEHNNALWKLRLMGGEYALNPHITYNNLQQAAVQMVPFKSIPWFLSSQWENGLESLRTADRVMIIGYSFPSHDHVSRYAIRSAIEENARAEIIVVDPRSGEPDHARTLHTLLGARVKVVPECWQDFQF